MRLNLIFDAPCGRLPIDYRPYIMSYFKAALSQSYAQIFNEQYNKDLLKPKSFTFAVLFKDSKITGEEIEFKGNQFSVIFSSFDNSFLLYLYNALVRKRNQTKNFNQEFAIKLKRIYLSPLPVIKSESVKIKFLSPLLVRQHDKEANKDIYLTFNDADFNNQLNVIVQYFISQNDIAYDKPIKILLIPKKARTTVVKNMDLMFCASIGEFELQGEKELLNILHKSGLGSRRGQGFGMFYVVN